MQLRFSLKNNLFTAILFVFTIALLPSCHNKENSGGIAIDWTDSIAGDFSFTDLWEYPEGIYKNDYGQLVCDGFCPEGIEQMRNEEGVIYPDSIKAYYSLVDTTHLYYTVVIDDWVYDSLGHMRAERIDADSVILETMLGVSTYRSLTLPIKDNYCYPQIDSYSPTPEGHTIIACKEGKISIDKRLWEKGIMKASFDFTFTNGTGHSNQIRWRGRIYGNVNSPKNS